MKIISNKTYKTMVQTFKDYEERINCLENDIYYKGIRIKGLTNKNSELKEDLQKSQSSVGGYVKHNNELKKDNELLFTENNRLKKRVDELKQSLEEQTNLTNKTKEELVIQSKNYVSQINELRVINSGLTNEVGTRELKLIEEVKELKKTIKDLTKCNENYKKELEKQHIQQSPKEYLTRQPKRRKKVA